MGMPPEAGCRCDDIHDTWPHVGGHWTFLFHWRGRHTSAAYTSADHQARSASDRPCLLCEWGPRREEAFAGTFYRKYDGSRTFNGSFVISQVRRLKCGRGTRVVGSAVKETTVLIQTPLINPSPHTLLATSAPNPSIGFQTHSLEPCLSRVHRTRACHFKCCSALPGARPLCSAAQKVKTI
jgi:hypothetical protein